MTLSRFWMTVTPFMAAAGVKLKAAPDGKLPVAAELELAVEELALAAELDVAAELELEAELEFDAELDAALDEALADELTDADVVVPEVTPKDVELLEPESVELLAAPVSALVTGVVCTLASLQPYKDSKHKLAVALSASRCGFFLRLDSMRDIPVVKRSANKRADTKGPMFPGRNVAKILQPLRSEASSCENCVRFAGRLCEPPRGIFRALRCQFGLGAVDQAGCAPRACESKVMGASTRRAPDSKRRNCGTAAWVATRRYVRQGGNGCGAPVTRAAMRAG